MKYFFLPEVTFELIFKHLRHNLFKISNRLHNRVSQVLAKSKTEKNLYLACPSTPGSGLVGKTYQPSGHLAFFPYTIGYFAKNLLPE